MRKLGYFGIGSAVVGVGVAAILLWPHEPKATDGNPGVRTGRATMGDVRVLLNETGTVEPVREVVVKPPISGTVRRLLVDEGQRVTEGQLLAVVEPDLTQARAVAELRAAYARAQVTLAQTERDLKEARSLASRGLIAESELVRRDSDHQRAQLELRSAEEQLRALEQAGVSSQQPAQNVKVIAPAAGVVIAVGAEEGESVLAGTGTLGGGTELVKIADLSELEIKAAVNEVDIGKVALGLPVKITVDAYPNVEFKGRVSHVAPAARIDPDNKVRVFDVEIAVDSPDERLRPGMTANIDVEGPERANVLTVPVEAVFRKGGRDVVYKIVDGQPVETPVTLGLADIAKVEVVAGLADGDTVALEDPTRPKPETAAGQLP